MFIYVAADYMDQISFSILFNCLFTIIEVIYYLLVTFFVYCKSLYFMYIDMSERVT